MAEIAVSLAIENLVPLLIQEAGLLEGVHKEVASVKAELEFIQALLKDADAKPEMEERTNVAKTWLKQVRDATYRIEDVIDESILHLRKRTRRENGFFNFFLKASDLIIKLKQRYETTSQVRDIKNTLNEIKQSGERYVFIANTLEQGGLSSGTTWHDPRATSHVIDETELVGIESPRNKLIGWLVEGSSRRMVMSVVGIGGLGKTTLVKKVYDNEKVITNFDCHAWITVSQSYRMEELLRDTIKQFYKEREEFAPIGLDAMGEAELMGELKKNLQQKSYVVVFDDIWNIQFWGHIKHALPDNGKGSRIIITTRNEDVAPSIKESSFFHVYKLLPLPPNKAWELFCKKVFQSMGHNCPPKLEKLSRIIVGKCEGLPLAIVAIGGVLSTKDKIVSEWQKFHDSLSSELETNMNLQSIKKILSFSYHNLPFYLKPCFLYFGMFPEDYSVNRERLFRLWIAEGFVKEMQGQILEEVAVDYLNQLIYRSLVQKVKVDIFGKVEFCRVHDMMREVILSRSEELSFCHISKEHKSSFDGIPRRLSIQKNINTILESITSSQTHSTLVFKASEFSKDLVTTLFTNLKLVKTLDFEDTPIDYIPKEVGNLFHLKYLSLKNTKVKIFPKSIGKLRNLETLDLCNSLVYELPAEISGLHKLRHLEAFSEDYDKEFSMDIYGAVKIQSGIGCLESLLTLTYVEANCIGLVEELGRLRQLRMLEISKINRENGMALCTALENMKSLQSLFVCSTNEEEYLELQSLSSPPPLLQSLRLYGRLEKLPEWISKLENVVQIYLNWSRMMDDPLKVLQALPNLKDFRLYEGYDGEQLLFEEGGFQKLKDLWIRNLKGLKKLIIEEGALPLLEHLKIGPSSQMKELPTGIHHLKNLKTLDFVSMPREFVLSMQPDGGQDFWKVKHIPIVHFNYRIKGERYRFYKLGDPKLLEFLQGDSGEPKCVAQFSRNYRRMARD